MDADDGALQQRVFGFWMTLGGLITLPLGFLAAYMFAVLLANVAGRFYPFVTLAVALGIVGIGAAIGANIASKRYNPRFRQWLDEAGRHSRGE